jgi:hypothetical protein
MSTGPCGGMVDAADSKSVSGNGVGVRVSPGAPAYWIIRQPLAGFSEQGKLFQLPATTVFAFLRRSAFSVTSQHLMRLARGSSLD